MASIGFSRPEGRVEIQYPDEMSLDDLATTVGLHIAIWKATKDNPPKTGRAKTSMIQKEQS